MTDLSGNHHGSNKKNISNSFHNVDLKESLIIDIPADIVFPTELNKHLKDKLQYLTHENGMLKKNLSENEVQLCESKTKIEALSAKIEGYEKSSNEFTTVPNIARTKIVDLSKKLREKTAELQTYKYKYSKLEQELTTAKQKDDDVEEKIVKVEKPSDGTESVIKSLQEKVESLGNKLFDEKNASLKLRNDLKVANKYLREEIGEQFDLQQNNSNWRGRSQIISDLQHKNNELREKLKLFQDKDGIKNLKKWNTLERKLEKMTKENDEMRKENADLKKRLELARGKCKNTDIECSTWKSKYNTLTQKIEKDTDLISTLSTQNAINISSQNEVLKKKESLIEKLQKDLKHAKQELRKETFKSENLGKALGEKEKELETCKSKSGLQAPVEDRTPQRFEAERIRMAELIAISNQRLNSERDARCNMENLYRQERQKAARLEAKVARLQLEESSEKGSTYSSLASKNFASREEIEYKLELAEENIKALQTRLDTQKREKGLDHQEFCNIIKNCTCMRD